MASTTTTSTSSIDPALLPYLTQGLEQAQNLFLTGQQPKYYPDQTYVNPSAETLQALDLTKQRALAGNPLVGQAQQFVGNQLNGQAQSPAMGFLTGAMNGGLQNAAMPYAQANMQNAFAQNPAMSMLNQTANGSFLNSNPYLDQMFNNAAGNVKTQVNSQFEGAGRTGSGAHAAALATPMNQLASNIYGGNYATERQNMLNAQGQIGNLAQQGFANQLNAANQLGNLSQQGIANQFAGAQGAQSAFTQQQQLGQNAAQLAPNLAAQDYSDISKLANVGAANEQIASMPLQDAMARYNFNQQLPFSQLSGYLSSVYGTPLGRLGTTTQTTQLPTNTMVNTLAGAGAGYLGGQALGSWLGGTPFSLTSPSGYGLAGAGLGGLLGGGLF